MGICCSGCWEAWPGAKIVPERLSETSGGKAELLTWPELGLNYLNY